MTSNRKDQICALLKAIETGDAAAVTVVNEDKYIQHNPQTHESSEGLAALFERLSKASPASISYAYSRMTITYSLIRSTTSQARTSASRSSVSRTAWPLNTGTTSNPGKVPARAVIPWSTGRPQQPTSIKPNTTGKSFDPS